MKILGIDTSCDETAISILEITRLTGRQGNLKFKILSNVVSSQVKLHAKYGGVYPSLAKREHQRNLALVLEESLLEARLLKSTPKQNPRFATGQEIKNQKSKTHIKNQKLKAILEREPELFEKTIKFLKKYDKPKIDAIAVTVGPGLEPALWVGVNFAKALGYTWGKPIISVNHIEAHIFANFLGFGKKIKNQKSPKDSPPNFGGGPTGQANIKNIFPAICLVVSGGHTQLILMRDFGKYQILGETRDDAAGECFDKVARILGLGYPGGPAIAAEAAMEVRSTKYEETKKSSDLQTSYFRLRLPRPMINQKNYDFSFSGLKTAVLYKVKELKTINHKLKTAFCVEIQQAIIDVLIRKTLKAAKDFRVKTIILGGGVAANEELRKQFQEKIKKELPNIQYLTPNIQFCTDNAAMVAATAYFRWKLRKAAFASASVKTSADKKASASQSWQKIEVDANLKI